MSEHKYVGKPLAPADAVLKVTGSLQYAVDKKVCGMLHGRLIRSQYPKATVLRIDAAAAEALPGFYGVLTHEDVPQREWHGCWYNYIGVSLDGRPRFYLDEIGVAVAETEEIAERALELIKVEYAPEQPVFSIEDAQREDAPFVRPNGGNCRPDCVVEWGDVAQGRQEADFVAETDIHYASQQYASIGRNACIAEWEGERVTVYTATQTPSELRDGLAEALDIPESQVRVVGLPGGSSLGLWWSNNFMMLTALAARKFGRPVRIELNNEECFAAVKRRHLEHSTVEMGCDQNGRLVFLDGVHDFDLGGYCWKDKVGGIGIDNWGARARHGRTCVRPVATNLVTAGCMRGVGDVTFTNAIERTADKLAEMVKMDPVEFRLLNQIKTGDRFRYFPAEKLIEGGIEGYYQRLPEELKKDWPELLHLTSGDTDEILRRGAELFRWKDRWKGWGVPAASEGNKRRGVGVGTGVHNNGVEMEGGVNAIVRITRDGSATLYCSLGRTGTNSEITQLQIMAETLGIPIERCAVRAGDTDTAPWAHGSIASNTAHRIGWATRQAALDARNQLLQIGSHEFFGDCPLEEMDIQNGEVFRRTSGPGAGHCYSVHQVVDHLRSDQLGHSGSITGRTFGVMPPSMHYSRQFAAQFAEVEVDIVTGQVKITDYLAMQDSGVALNPQVLSNQVLGGAIAGLGFALVEEMVFDMEKGKVLNPGFQDYKVLRISDFPAAAARAVLVEEPCPVGPYGARGAGESPIAAAVPALCQAVYNAVGVWVDVPMTPERVLKALGKF